MKNQINLALAIGLIVLASIFSGLIVFWFFSANQDNKDQALRDDVMQIPELDAPQAEVVSESPKDDDQDRFSKIREDQLIWTLTKGGHHNPIFRNDNTAYKSGDKSRDADVRRFLTKIGLTSLFDLEDIAGDRKLSQEDCEQVLSVYNPVSEHAIPLSCSYGEDVYQDGTKPFKIFFYDLDDRYLYLNMNSNGNGLGGATFVNKAFDTKSQEVLDIDPELVGGGSYSDGVMWFSMYGKVSHSYDLNSRKYTSHEGREHNKSEKWWIENQEDSFKVESFDGRTSINLGKLAGQDFQHHDYVRPASYFETSMGGSKFAVVNSIECGNGFGDCSLFIRHGDMVENGLEDSEVFSVKLHYIETACWADGNASFFWDRERIITTSGCPVSAELTVYDTINNKFLYRHGKAQRSYLKIEDSY